ncbi:MAG: peptidylprolyl isomerase [Porticoccaceae bacterium]
MGWKGIDARRAHRGGRAVSALLLALLAGAVPAMAGEPGVIATGAGIALTGERLDTELSVLPPEVLNQLADDPQAALTFANGLMKLRVFTRAAERAGVAEQPGVRVAIETARARILGDALRQQVLAEIREPDYRALAAEQYKIDKARYAKPEQVKARHILLKAASEDSVAVAGKRARLEALMARARAGESFADLARQYSEDEGSAGLGGELPLFPRGRMAKPFEQAAFALRAPGELSDIVQTQYGLHLIQLIEHQPGGPMSFEEAEKFIVSKLRVEYRENYLVAWERDLMRAADIQIDADQLRVLMAAARARLAQLPVDVAAPAAGP